MAGQIDDSGRPAAYKQLQSDLLETYSPANAFERVIVQEFIDARWDFQCAREVDHEYWEWLGGHYKPGALAGVAEAQFYEHQDKLRLHMRHRTEAERSYYRALAALERMERNRKRHTTEPQRTKAVAGSKTMAAASVESSPGFTGEITASSPNSAHRTPTPAHASPMADETEPVRRAGSLSEPSTVSGRIATKRSDVLVLHPDQRSEASTHQRSPATRTRLKGRPGRPARHSPLAIRHYGEHREPATPTAPPRSPAPSLPESS